MTYVNSRDDSFDVRLHGERNFRLTGENHDIGYIYYLDVPGNVVDTIPLENGSDFVVDMAADGKIHGIEIMGQLSNPAIILAWLPEDMREDFKVLHEIWLQLMKRLMPRACTCQPEKRGYCVCRTVQSLINYKNSQVVRTLLREARRN